MSASANAACTAASVSGVSIANHLRSACAVDELFRPRTDGAPLGPPFADALAATGAAHVLDGSHAADKQLHQLTQRRLVERAAAEPGRRVERDRPRDLEQDRRSHAPDGAVGVAPGDTARVTERDGA